MVGGDDAFAVACAGIGVLDFSGKEARLFDDEGTVHEEQRLGGDGGYVAFSGDGPPVGEVERGEFWRWRVAEYAEVDAAVVAGLVEVGGFSGGPVDKLVDAGDGRAGGGCRVEGAAGFEDAVAECLGVEAAAVVAAEEEVVGVDDR